MPHRKTGERNPETLPDAKRSALMSRVRSRNTTPELAVRRLAHALGYRFRLHKKALPGTPDLVFAGRKKVIFVHGCFWHRHQGCSKASTPKTRKEFWQSKFNANMQRDARNVAALKQLGWDVLVVWECETLSRSLKKRLSRFLVKTAGS